MFASWELGHTHTPTRPARRLSLSRSDDAGLVGQDDCLGSVAETELVQQVRNVGLDGVLAQEEHLRDLGVRVAAAEMPQDLPLARRELVEALRSTPGARPR